MINIRMLKRGFIALFAVAFLTLALVACGDEKTESSDNQSNTDETTAVLETTADGGTVELDADGNTITRDKDGNIISIKDSAGNPIDLQEYARTHSWALEYIITEIKTSGGNDSGSGGGNSYSGNSKDSGSNGSSGNNSGSGGSNQSNRSNDSSDQQEDAAEEEIPVIIATLPDDGDVVELPSL